MRCSSYFLPTLKENPSEAKVPSHRLMLRSGMIRMVTAGVYNWLPLGLRVIRKVENIVREEMDKAGAQEVFMPMVQPAELWQETGRWDKYDTGLLLKFKDRHDHAACLGPTHEEIVTDLFRGNVKSYREVPVMLYQIQTKFRDETRPRFGIMRGREFMMKDCYSFDINPENALKSYNIMKDAYHKIFTRLGLDYRVVLSDSGDIGGDLSEEFQVLAENGEDDLLFDPNGEYAVNVEKHNPEKCNIPEDELQKAKGIEVGNIFYLGETYSKPMKAQIRLQDGSDVNAFMGCYGIGVSRTVAAAIEQNNDEKGIVWSKEMAPFNVGLINLRIKDDECNKVAEEMYELMQQKGIEVLYDDRDENAGTKFANMDLIGLPWQAVIGPKSIKNGEIEWKNRKTDEHINLPIGTFPEGI